MPPSSEDEAIELPQLITSVMDFVSSVARNGQAKDWFAGDNSIALVSAVFDYIQMTDDDVRASCLITANCLNFVAQYRKKFGPTMPMPLSLKKMMTWLHIAFV